jgi:hypothetical protein
MPISGESTVEQFIIPICLIFRAAFASSSSSMIASDFTDNCTVSHYIASQKARSRLCAFDDPTMILADAGSLLSNHKRLCKHV